MRLKPSFFNRSAVQVAQELIGKRLRFHNFSGLILETESYRGSDDPASHAFRGPTPRTAPMFGPPGFSYVYFIYGMYHCFNITCEKQNHPAAVLIRAVQPDNGPLLKGPGKLCKEWGITKEHNGLNLIDHPSFFVEETGLSMPFESTPRIGINRGKEKLWRFVAKTS